LTLCGSQATDFTKVGKNWEIDVSVALCRTQALPEYDVLISATDESGISNSLNILVIDPFYTIDSSDVSTDDSDDDSESSGLPSVSLLATLSVTLLGAAFARRKLE
jgi:hypothetical protein